MKKVLTVLVADDDPSDRLLLKEILDRFGYNVILAEDGQDAVNKYDPSSIHLVCLGTSVPSKSGWDTALEIQAKAGDNFTPIVFSSKEAPTVAPANFLRVGGVGFISKPYSPYFVVAKLNSIVQLFVLQGVSKGQFDLDYENSPQLAAADDIPVDLSFEYVLNADSLRNSDPLPYVLNVITSLPGGSVLSRQIFMILSELYSNALEHGVLNLDSNSKHSVDGFSVYYEERQKKLKQLTEGYVKISVKVVSHCNERNLILYVEDSGKGFDFNEVSYELPNEELLYNRGLALVKGLCSKIEFSKGGRAVSAYYDWSTSPL
ncbi:response regulator [Marinomonas sp. C2222]|uniref:Response regulator n=1 Tax=Marinomonas sargassi TaxID=2984494 RepID=A0ABT2YNR1_9GAMM|nr:response regulator [Marinomonas sargassi]MCV2401390.1 response regulator [Marinomonas sargassi]